MATIHKEVLITADPQQVWAAIRDVGAVHRRLVPGLVTDAFLDGDARVVTFASGSVVREVLIDLDDSARRFCYSVTESTLPFTHHNSVIQVFAAGPGRSRLVWITDVLPDEVAGAVSALVEQGSEIMKRTLEAA